MSEALDKIPLWAVFVATVLLLVLASEVGFRLARRPGDQDSKGLAATLLGDMLVLLAFMLGFCFTVAAAWFIERQALVVEEANAIGTTYLRASFLPAPERVAVRQLLRSYVDLTLVPGLHARIGTGLRRSQAIQHELWQHAEVCATAQPQALPVALFLESLSPVIDVHQKRVTADVYRRLPTPILLTLFAVALLAMVLQGYHAGLIRNRLVLPSLSVMLSVAMVLILIIDLDRPWEGMFNVSHDALETLRAMMAAER
jgi:hypothetical protein